MKDSKRAQGYCFTINNYTNEDLGDILELQEHCDYLVIGWEVGESGTPHLQGFCYARNKISFRQVKKILVTAHIDRMKGTPLQALLYCQKDGEYYEYGTRPQQGKRNDLHVIQNDIRYQKKTPDEIANQYFSEWCYHRKSFDVYAKQHIKYETQVYYYTDGEIPLVYEAYDHGCNLIIQSMDENCYYHKLLHLMYSKKYKYILIPYGLYQANRELLSGKVFPIE